jgi:hypothetical protein
LVGPGSAYERWKQSPAYQGWLKDTEQALGNGKEKSAEKPLAKPVPSSFVILARGGRAEQKLASLAEAVQFAGNGDTIEVRGNGPFRLDPVVIQDRALCIRAGEGFRPVFSVGPREKPDPDQGGILVSHSPLVVEGLDFQQATPDQESSSRRGRIIVGYGPLFMANCRFIVRELMKGGYAPMSSVIAATGANHCEVCNCQIFGDVGLTSIHTSSKRTILRNNVIVSAGYPLWMRFAPTTNAIQRLQLTRNTLVGRNTPPVCMFLPNPAAGEVSTQIRIEASGNIFQGKDVSCYFWLNAEKSTESMQKQVAWAGDHNLFAPKARVSMYTEKNKPTMVVAGLTDWKQFWGNLETGSVESVPEYRGGDISVWLAEPGSTTPEHLALLPASAGHRAGPNSEDLGADVDLVGPGPAYERWKKTPAYQDWLKSTGLPQ